MNTILATMVLAGSVFTSATDLTGRELALLRVILRQSMRTDQHAAYESGDALTKDRFSPLELAMSDPNVEAIHEIVTNEANDEYKRLSAARALAYLGDKRCIDILAKTLAGKFAMTSSCTEQSQAAACLLYLGYDFPKDFLFTKLANPLYPELNAFLPDPNESPIPPIPPIWPQPQYSERYVFTAPDPNFPCPIEQVEKVVAQYVHTPVGALGPLSVGDVEQAELQLVLDLTATDKRSDLLRLPFADRYDAWQDFKDQMCAVDFLYFFGSGGMTPSSVFIQGYVLIRNGEVAGHFPTFPH